MNTFVIDFVNKNGTKKSFAVEASNEYEAVGKAASKSGLFKKEYDQVLVWQEPLKKED